MADKLKPCPFCNGEAILSDHADGYYGLYVIVCDGCGVMTDYYNTAEEAIEAWNRRVSCTTASENADTDK